MNARAMHTKSVVHYAALSFLIAFFFTLQPSTHSICHCTSDFSLSNICSNAHVFYSHKSPNNIDNQINNSNSNNNKKTNISQHHDDNDNVWLIQHICFSFFLLRSAFSILCCHSCFYWHCVIKWMFDNGIEKKKINVDIWLTNALRLATNENAL